MAERVSEPEPPLEILLLEDSTFDAELLQAEKTSAAVAARAPSCVYFMYEPPRVRTADRW